MSVGGQGQEQGEQLTLLDLPTPPPAKGRGARALARDGVQPAAELPVARVCVDLPPAHLDRAFEYVVPAALSDAAQPGTRVKVRFGGQDVDGYLLERIEHAEHDGTLAPLRRVVSPEQVLTPEVHALARAVADRYAGTLADVLRLAIPARHARVEGAAMPAAPTTADDVAGEPEPTGADAPGTASASPDSTSASAAEPADTLDSSAWRPYRGGPAFLQHLGAGGAPRAVLSALPGPAGERWPDAIAQAAAACVAGGRGALVVVPDARDVVRVCAALDAVGIGPWSGGSDDGSAGGYVRLLADDGPAPRYRAFLAALRGQAQVVVGTRAAAFAPVSRLGLVACWDDGDDLHVEPRAPHPHVREVLALRAAQQGAAFLLAAHGRTVEAQALVELGWAHDVAADRAVVRARTPQVRALTSVELAREGAAGAARLPGPAARLIRERLADGPVLVQVPRAGYLPVVACDRCRAVARCGACHGALALGSAQGVPQCEWCGRLATGWRCAECGASSLRSVRVGSDRTAEELGRAFPGVPVRSSGARSAAGVIATVPDTPALVVATTGAEPVCEGGYAGAVLLDAGVGAMSTSLSAGEDAVRRWLAAAALVRSHADGGVVALVGDGAPGPTQALVRWDPAGLASRDLVERRTLALPPVVRVAAVTGTREAVQAVVDRLELPPGGGVLGPVPVTGSSQIGVARRSTRAPAQETLDAEVRVLVRAPLSEGGALVRTLAASLAVRSARREGGTVRVQVDPAEML
ncbi:primosomal protein N' [Cellulomonas cellasea]|uniref:primosomal protein N' n=1 Tax=Cellulomonas cellasea TaxID=43670 RepID=UPI0025A3852B|nr:primosomal protein N' [Cellulomonas cellasea]MDM8083895.1 primosomal protein N' [Cellulomonas cellasea]